jgi:hypothetical protein
MMRFCTSQRQFYCGIDLHARTKKEEKNLLRRWFVY